MKTPLHSIAALLALAAFLAACSRAPLTVPLADFDVSIDATTNTLGFVVYPYAAARFDQPIRDTKTVTLSGVVKADYASLTGDSLTMTFYARAADPAQDPNCNGSSGVVWICQADGEHPITGSYTFTNGAEQSISFGGTNAVELARGVNAGEIWIGARIESGVATNVTLEFTRMVARVTLF